MLAVYTIQIQQQLMTKLDLHSWKAKLESFIKKKYLYMHS